MYVVDSSCCDSAGLLVSGGFVVATEPILHARGLMTVMPIVPVSGCLLGTECNKVLPVFRVGAIYSCWAIRSVVRQADSWPLGLGLRIKLASLQGGLF